MSKIKTNISNKKYESYSFLRFAIFGLLLILISGIFIVAKIVMVYF
ncbi:MAG: hypothetical protein PHE33_06195 [Bacteroidales bacterium]|nr:hypothetical protein [Bacteroidales bacterium]